MAAQGGPLGCAAEYRAVITDRCRSGGDGAVRVEFRRIQALSFNRTLNGISSATVVLDRGCCEELREARQGREMILFRDGEQVHRGELLDDPRDCRDSASVTSFDRFGILSRRLIHETLCFRAKCGGAPASALAIARRLIEDGFSGDDRCYDAVYLGDCVSPLEREYGKFSSYTIEALNDLTNSRIDYTTHGDRMIVMCKDYALGQTATLTCRHFAEDACAGSGGLSSATRVVVVGDGVFGEAGGPDPYYGLLEARVEDDSIKTQDAATEEARARLRALRPPVTWVDAPSGSQLTSDAPVSMSELVPGVLVPVQLDCACTPLSEVMRLTDVTVSYGSGAGGGEKVGITLTSVNQVGNDGPTTDSEESDG